MSARGVDDSREVVVLLHGVALNRWFMRPIARHLETAGYRAMNLAYPSRTVQLRDLAATWLPAQLALCGVDSAACVHFVAHSMGSLLVRHHFARARPANLGRTVFIAPPNRGAELADAGRPQWLFRTVIGTNLRALGLSKDAFWRTLPQRADFPLGIIAGTGHGNPFGRGLPDPNDGTVTVESTRLDGAADSIELPWSHTANLFRDRTANQTLHFLRHGRFEHGGGTTERSAPR